LPSYFLNYNFVATFSRIDRISQSFKPERYGRDLLLMDGGELTSSIKEKND
tara:strand:+ start:86 stop:238 length:153 start_codon:yes stop_codon:yes gene_type:complete